MVGFLLASLWNQPKGESQKATDPCQPRPSHVFCDVVQLAVQLFGVENVLPLAVALPGETQLENPRAGKAHPSG